MISIRNDSDLIYENQRTASKKIDRSQGPDSSALQQVIAAVRGIWPDRLRLPTTRIFGFFMTIQLWLPGGYFSNSRAAAKLLRSGSRHCNKIRH